MKSIKTQLSLLILISFIVSGCTAPGGQTMRAFLPMENTVQPTTGSEIDGVWRINTINKKIRIDRGRAYAIDSWMHMGLLQVQPNMVVIKNIQSDGRGGFSGYDLPLLGNWSARLGDDGNLNVTVSTGLGPIPYKLIAVDNYNLPDDSEYTDPDHFNDPRDRPRPPFIKPPGNRPPNDPITNAGLNPIQIGKNCYNDFKPMTKPLLDYGICQAGAKNFNAIREAIKAKRVEDAKSIFAAYKCKPQFDNLIRTLKKDGFKSLSLGVSAEGAGVVGLTGEIFIASNLDLSHPTIYSSVGASIGTQAGASLNGVVSAFYNKADQLSGSGKSFSVSLKAAGGAGGAVGISSGRSARCESFSASAGGGVAVNAGSISTTQTFKFPKLSFIHKPDFSKGCKAVLVSIKNNTGYEIKIVDVDFYDYVNNRWRSKIIKNTKVKKGRSWRKKLRLQKVGGDKTRVKFQYRVKNKKGLFKKYKWSKVKSRETSAKTCRRGTKFYKNLN